MKRTLLFLAKALQVCSSKILMTLLTTLLMIVVVSYMKRTTLLTSNEDYWENFPPEQPEANKDDVIDKYLNAKLIFNLGTNDEQCAQVVKRARGPKGEQLAAHVITLCLTLANMMLSLPIGCMSNIKQM
jgi:hypothetical protein